MEIDREVVFSYTISTDVAHPPSELQNNILICDARADQASAPIGCARGLSVRGAAVCPGTP